MPDLFIRNIDENLLKRFNNRLNKLRSCGVKRGDKRKYVIEAITQWLDNTTPRDRGHAILQKEIDSLKDEITRLKQLQVQGHYQEGEE